MLYREGISVVLAGPPNAGKSSLLNALLRSDRAIVTALPGTTRDVIEESIAIRGIPVRLVDTAGLREAMDEIEKIGVNRSRERIRSADIVLLVRDATDRSAAVAIEDVPCGVACITVWNKIDLDGSFAAPGTDTAVSALTGQGIALLEERIADTALAGVSGEPRDADGPVVTHARHNHALESALDAIGRARAVLDSGEPLDFFSIELQCALDAVGLISGETTSPDIVTEIFHRFCIGK
jgi:tRNA modification GTPase